jgi:hypothetical protein
MAGHISKVLHGAMRWIGDGEPLEPMIRRASRLSPDELNALANRYDPRRSNELRRPVSRDLALGVAWELLPPEAYALCDAVSDATARAGLPPPAALRAWEAVADAMTARLFPSLPAPHAEALSRAWNEVVEEDSAAT